MVTTVLDLLAIVCLSVLAWFIWEPLPLGVIAAAALLASRKASK